VAYVNRNTYNSMKKKAEESAGRKRAADSEVKQAAARLNQLGRESAGMSAADLQRMQRQFDNANRALQTELEELRVELGLQLGRQAVETRKRLDEIRRMAEGNKRDLEAVNRQITDLEAHMNREFQRLARQVEDKRKQALCCYDRYRELLERMQELDPEKHELLYPNVLQPGSYVLRTGLGYVLDNIRQGSYEAAVGVAQTRIPETTRALGHLEFFDGAYRQAREAAEKALSGARRALEELAADKKTVVIVEGGVEYDDDHRAPYWARELYEELRQRVEECEASFTALDEARDAEGLTALTGELQEIREQLTACGTVEENERQLHYECRESLSRIYEALDRNDPGLWSLEGVFTNESDLRDPVYMLLRRPEGYCLAVVCAPERSAEPLGAGTVRCFWQVFDRGRGTDDPVKCAILHANVTEILLEAGIRAAPEGKENIAPADSASFTRRAAADEAAARSRWLDQTRRVIGLHKKGETAHG